MGLLPWSATILVCHPRAPFLMDYPFVLLSRKMAAQNANYILRVADGRCCPINCDFDKPGRFQAANLAGSNKVSALPER